MAYDRYDNRGDDRGRGRWRDDDRDYRRGEQRDGRGFFERAREEVSSWFGDEDSGDRRDDRYGSRDRDSSPARSTRDRDDRYGSSDRGMFGSGGEPWGRGRHDDDRFDDDRRYGSTYSRSDDNERYSRSERGGMFTGDDDRDSGRRSFGQSGSRHRDRDYPGTLGQTAHRDRSYGDPRGGSRRDNDYRPMTGNYGASGDFDQDRGSGMGGQVFSRSQYGRQDFSQDQDRDRRYGERTYNYGGWGDRESQRQGSRSRGHDDHYSSWRQRQIEELDRDYEDYRREHQSKFENEFSGWRQQKQTKRQMLHSIREHMEVVDESGEHIGTVDKVRGDTIILTRNDPSAGGVHRSFSCSLLDRVDDKVHLDGTAATIRSKLHEEREDRDSDDQGGGFFSGLFGGERSDKDRRDERSTTTNRPEGEGPHVLDRSFSGTYDDEKK